MSRSVPKIVLFVTLSVLSTGCEHFQRARECRAVARLVNPALSKIDDARRKSPDDAAVHRRIAKDYDRLAISLIALKPMNKRVQELIADYQRLFHEASRDASQYADALGAKDDARVLAARASANRTTKHETGALSHAEGVCRTK